MTGTGINWAPVADRAAELTAMPCDPKIRCVVPPWGGETAIDLIDLLDWDALTQAEPTSLVGYSDLSTILLSITTRLGWDTLHGDNFVDTPYQTPAGLLPSLYLASGIGPHVQQDSGLTADGWRFEEDPRATEWKPAGNGRWSLHGGETLHATGRLIGGCAETLRNLAGTLYGDVATFGAAHRDDGLIIYLEAAGDDAATICRNPPRASPSRLVRTGERILFGRTHAPDNPKLTQREAVLDALGRLDIPIVFDLEIGHLPPHMPLINGALATVRVTHEVHEVVQQFK